MHWLGQQYFYVECQFNFLVYDIEGYGKLC
jgi:hypothetical protein